MEFVRRSVQFPWSFRKTAANQLPSLALQNKPTFVKSIKYQRRIKYFIFIPFIFIKQHGLILLTRSTISGTQATEKASHAVLTFTSAGLDETSLFSLSIFKCSTCEHPKVSQSQFSAPYILSWELVAAFKLAFRGKESIYLHRVQFRNWSCLIAI